MFRNFDYDLFVIGAGPGGMAAAEQAARYSVKVAIAEQDLVGGTCVIRGCIPEKLMYYAATFAELYQDGVGYGWKSPSTSFDWQQFIKAKNQEIHRLSQVHMETLKKLGVELIPKRAKFVDAHTLEVGGQQITADKILIAVGGEAVKPNVPGIKYAITSREVFDLQQQPQRVAVIGNNYIAIKLAGILHGLGSQVTLIIPENQILPDCDQDLCMAVTESMANRGIQILANTEIAQIERIAENELNLILAGEHDKILSVDTVLCVTGRAPNLEGLNLEKAGVKVKQSQNCPLFNSLAQREEKTLIKLVVDRTSDRVFGIHMVGSGAVEIIQCLAIALRMGATKKDFDSAIGLHPSVAEEFLTLR